MMENFSEPIFFSRATALRYRVEFTGESAAVVPRLDAAEFIYFDTNLSSLSRLEQHLSRLAENIFSQEVAQAESSPKIFNRADWGANESYRFTAEGKEVWPAKQSAVEKIIIHHTAGGSGQEDPQSTIRGIYYWHAKVLGWGDIGYNYLIDQEGNIYEGRYGGDGVIGGHTFNSETNTNYNVGTMRETGFISDPQTVSIRFKNTGSETWGQHATYLEIFDSGYRSSRYSPGTWSNEFGRIPFSETEVAPGATATFTLQMKAPNEPGLFHTIWRIRANDQETTNGEKVIVTRADSHFQVFLTGHNIPPAMLSTWRPEITVRLKNVGHAPWDRKMTLDILGENGSKSAFGHSSWPDESRGWITLKER